jgi:3-methyladenine DNA glycosylase/8-oxoguanine DNA glycosylase
MPATTPSPPPDTTALLAHDRRPGGWDVARTVLLDRPSWGAVATSPGQGIVRRMEPGSRGPVTLEARSEASSIALEVWGPPDTPAAEVEAHLADAAGWAACEDDLTGYLAIVGAHPVVAEVHRRNGPYRLSRLPRVGEALGRAVLGQLVQGVEARRSARQVAARAGTAGGGGLWAWPTARQMATTDAWVLRRCGVSLRSARALHAGAVDDASLRACGIDWPRLDARLRALPGVGAWTSGETRFTLGDPDAVPVGDYNFPAVVGTALTGQQRARADWTDDEMLALLEPFTGQRGRIIRLVVHAGGGAARHHRRAPRAALSAHRYW